MIRSRRFLGSIAFATCLLSCSIAYAGTSGVRHAKERVPNSYIVMLASGNRVQDVGPETERRYAGKVTALMPHLDMFAITLPNETAAEAIAKDPRVLLVQENSILHLAGCRDLDPSGSQWSLAHLNDPSQNIEFGTNMGSYLNWVSVWVIDSRINTFSSDFMYANGGNKIREVADYIGECTDNGGLHPPYADGSSFDHGGAVASIIGGNVHGIAPELTVINSIVAVDCLGASSDSALSQAADCVIANHQAGTAAVGNISIVSNAPDSIFDAAVLRMLSNGIFVAAAAGNQGTDACSVSPAELGGSYRISGFMAVGATNIYGSRTSYSNTGACVDIWAPGGETNSNDSYDKGVMTSEGAVVGTSFASPHVAGAAVVIYSRYPYWTASSVWSQIKYDSVNTWGLLMLRIPAGCIAHCFGCIAPPPQQQ